MGTIDIGPGNGDAPAPTLGGGGAGQGGGRFSQLIEVLDATTAAANRTAFALLAAGNAARDASDKVTQAKSWKGAMGIDDLDAECKRLGITMGELQQRMIPIGGVLQNFATSAQTATGNLNGLASAQGQCNDALGQGIGVQGKATVIMLQVQQATEAQTAALKEMLKAQDALNASQEKTLDTATGWKDYLVTLTENYKSGTSSLLVYIQSLNDFAMQLRTLFAGAKGEAKAALQDMIDMIQKLVVTAGSVTPNTDTSYGGSLNNLFNKPKP